MRTILFPWALAALSLPNLARADVFVVDDDGPADFADLPEAVAAAGNNDALIVRPGTYSRFILQNKGVKILGDPWGSSSMGASVSTSTRVEWSCSPT